MGWYFNPKNTIAFDPAISIFRILWFNDLHGANPFDPAISMVRIFWFNDLNGTNHGVRVLGGKSTIPDVVQSDYASICIGAMAECRQSEEGDPDEAC